jgi:hypothetical protein
MNREYKPDIRENDPIFLLRNAQELLQIGKENNNSSSLIYACLDSRIALENLELNIILHSVKPEERSQIIEETKPKNGIEKVGKKQGSLKEKYQTFFQALCEIAKINAKSFDFKKSKDLQYKLSTYIHSYYMTNEDLNYESELMQNSIKIVNEVSDFIKSYLTIEKDSYVIFGVDMESMLIEDKLLLEEWKKSSKMTYESLKYNIEQNLLKRE